MYKTLSVKYIEKSIKFLHRIASFSCTNFLLDFFAFQIIQINVFQALIQFIKHLIRRR